MNVRAIPFVLSIFVLVLGGCNCGNEGDPDGGADGGDAGQAACGNGAVEGAEECDDGNTADGDGCSSTCTNEGATACGDGILQAGEECDDGANNSDTVSGACRTTCVLPSCGDGVTDTGEACDDGVNNSDSLADACRTRCVAAGCGDSVIDASEQCDDGNGVPGDGCDQNCNNEAPPRCGDGILQAGETCDDGLNNSDTAIDACRSNCQAAGCGDGVVDTGDVCDDGPRNDDNAQAACRTDCRPARCGDSVVDYVNGENCDDGNVRSGDGCSDTCQQEATPSCGDGVLDLAVGEQCDDGNTTNGDGCSDVCRFELLGATCGDGVVDPGEVCDNGRTGNGDLCDLQFNPVCLCNPPCDCNFTCNLTATTSLYAGTPGSNNSRDGDRLTTARFDGNVVLATSDTHLYLSEEANAAMRQIDYATGLVSTIAGTGNRGYNDDPDGLLAQFELVEAIATDGITLYVADVGNHLIRGVDLTSPTFAVTTLAGVQYTGNPGTPRYVDNVDPRLAEFGGMRGLTYYANVVYLLDPSCSLRSYDTVTGEVATLAGTPNLPTPRVGADGYGTAATFDSPRYMASDGSGMLYIADTNGNQIRTYNTVTTYVGTFVGQSGVQGYADGVGTAAVINRPRGMTSDGTSIYWVEFNAQTVRQADIATGTVTTLIGFPAPANCGGGGGYAEGTGTAALLSCPFNVVYHFPSRSLFLADSGNSIIRQVQ